MSELEDLRGWANWLIRHHGYFLLVAMNWTVQPAVALLWGGLSKWAEVWSTVKDNSVDLRKAAQQAKGRA